MRRDHRVLRRPAVYDIWPTSIVVRTLMVDKGGATDLVSESSIWRAVRFIRERRNSLWVAPPGLSKSHLVQAIGYHAITGRSYRLRDHGRNQGEPLRRGKQPKRSPAKSRKQTQQLLIIQQILNNRNPAGFERHFVAGFQAPDDTPRPARKTVGR